jgi:hypothetical protein
MFVPTRRRRTLVLALLAALALVPAARADDDTSPACVTDSAAPAWMKTLNIDPASDVAKKYEEQAAARTQSEKEIRRLRLKHFGQLRNTAIRQEGLLKLRQYTDPALFPLMVDVFAREQDDVRFAVLDILSDSATPEGDAALAWQAVFGRDSIIREESTARLAMRNAKAGATEERVKLVIYEGLKSKDETTLVRSANLADSLGIVEAIPWLAAAQLNAAPAVGGGGTGARPGALAWIALGTQTAYVADLEPVVSESAVAFDPKVASITSGVVMRVLDAVVVTYHIEVHTALTRLASKAWGADIDLGWGYPAWRKWYKVELLPELERRKVEDARRATEAPSDLQTPTAPAPGGG